MVKEMSNLTHVYSFDHISSSTNVNLVILVALESRLEELSNNRSHAPFRFLDQKL